MPSIGLTNYGQLHCILAVAQRAAVCRRWLRRTRHSRRALCRTSSKHTPGVVWVICAKKNLTVLAATLDYSKYIRVCLNGGYFGRYSVCLSVCMYV